MAGFEPRKEYAPQPAAQPNAGVPLRQNPLVQATVQALGAKPAAVSAPGGVYARQQLPQAGQPLGATPEAPKTAEEQQAKSIQQQSQSTHAANTYDAPGKEPGMYPGGATFPRAPTEPPVGNPATPNIGPAVTPTPPAARQGGYGVVTGPNGFRREVTSTPEEVAAGHAADQKRVADDMVKNRMFGLKQSMDYDISRAMEYRDPMERAMRMAAAQKAYDTGAAQFGAGQQLGVQQQQADAQTKNADANMVQANAQDYAARNPKVDRKLDKIDYQQRDANGRPMVNRKTGVPVDPIQVPVTVTNGVPDLAPLAAMAQRDSTNAVQSEYENRGFGTKLKEFILGGGETPESLGAKQQKAFADIMAQYGITVDPNTGQLGRIIPD